MVRSNKPYPLEKLDIIGTLKKAWYEGWLDKYSDEHFLIKSIEGRLKDFYGYSQFRTNDIGMYKVDENSFQEIFCLNLSARMLRLIELFGENSIKSFFIDKLSAGKNTYNEEQFFRALSEISILSHWAANSKNAEYEPRTNGNKNPEARFICNNGVIVDIEVKTPGFYDFNTIKNIAIPTFLLDEVGKKEFIDYCNANGIHGHLPRVQKLKDFLNSAADKFEDVDHITRMNILYINWTYSEFDESGFEEALSLLINSRNGIISNKQIGISLGINPIAFEKITAIVVYTESLSGLMFNDFSWVWTRNKTGMPHFGIVGLHNSQGVFETTLMNPEGIFLTPALLYTYTDTNHFEYLMKIISDHLL